MKCLFGGCRVRKTSANPHECWIPHFQFSKVPTKIPTKKKVTHSAPRVDYQQHHHLQAWRCGKLLRTTHPLFRASTRGTNAERTLGKSWHQGDCETFVVAATSVYGVTSATPAGCLDTAVDTAVDTSYLFATFWQPRVHFWQPAQSKKPARGRSVVERACWRVALCRVLVLVVLQPGVAWAHALQVKRRVRRWPVLGRWWCAVLRLPLGLHSAALAGDVVGRQHSMRGQV